MTTATQALQQYIGKQATFNCDGLMFQVKITNAKNTYGQDRLQIKPVAGTGEKWVNIASLKFEDRKERGK